MGRLEDIDGFSLAAWRKKSVRVVYRDGGGHRTTRVIEPDRVFGNRGGTAYVRAYCRLRGESRTFRLDRIEWWEEVPSSWTSYWARYLGPREGLMREAIKGRIL